MATLMRCLYCGLLQDEPRGVKSCARCGGELTFEEERKKQYTSNSYLSVQMELDQIFAPAGKILDRFVLLTISSPKKVPDKFKSKKHTARPPINFNPVLDRSGSMHGDKIRFAKEAVASSTGLLKEGDSFSLTTYSSETNRVFDAQPITASYLAEIKEQLAKITPGGSTALHAGLENGIKAALKLTREANLVLLLSDGLANIGETDLEIIGQSAKKAAQQDITVSTIGVGPDYNEAMMAEIASQGSGRFYHIESPDQIPNFIAGELGESANWAAKDLEIRLALPKGASAMAVSSIYPVTQSGQTVILSAGDIPCDTWIEIPVRISFPVQAVGNKLTISGKFSHGTPAGKDLGGAANSVMLRIKDKASFLPTSGVVEDVLVKVFEKRKAASLINIKRAMFSRRMDDREERKKSANELREYASRLGKERSEREMREVERYVSDLYGPSHLSKSRIYDSYAKTRGQKDFRK